jgi:hypothetical protein
MLRLLIAILFLGPAATLPAAEVLEEIFERDYAINPNSKFTLQNQDGSVRIYGADTSEMKLMAIKKAYTKERLSKIDVDVAVQEGVVAIKTGFPPKSKWGFFDRSGTVDYIIVLPWFCDVQRVDLANGELLIDGMRGNEVHAHLNNGRLYGHNCFTDLHLSIGTGGVDVSYDWWETHELALDTSIAEGTARLLIPGDAEFRIHADAPNGRIFTDFTSDDVEREGRRTTLELSIGSTPNADMKVQALDGNIDLKEAFQ